MKLDRRLIRRRGWISEPDLERELAALPDVASKAASKDSEAEKEAAGSVAGRSAPAGSESLP